MHAQTKSRFFALALAIAVASVAMADSGEVVSSRTIRFADLNLQTREGATAVYRRIEHAADAMCSVSWGIRTLGGTSTMAAQVSECKSEAIEHAVAKVKAPMLTAVLEEKSARKHHPLLLAHAP